jgi:hypothetical protein
VGAPAGDGYFGWWDDSGCGVSVVREVCVGR